MMIIPHSRTSAVLIFIILISSVLVVCGIKFDHRVRPACPREAKICEFSFAISQQETMIWYDRTKHKGYPILKANGTFFKRLPENCNELETMDDAGGCNKLLGPRKGEGGGGAKHSSSIHVKCVIFSEFV